MTTYTTPTTMNKWRKLTDLVIELTYSGGIVWKESVVDDEFITSISDVVISLSRQRIRDSPMIVITLSTKQGKKVDEFNDEDLVSVDGESYYMKLDSLLNDINRKISGAEEFLDSLLADLEDKSIKF